jgi:hypothetical protein
VIVVPGPELPDNASLMRQADKTMQRVKRAGGGVRLYDPGAPDDDRSARAARSEPQTSTLEPGCGTGILPVWLRRRQGSSRSGRCPTPTWSWTSGPELRRAT